MKHIYLIACLTIVFFSSLSLKATHYHGGEITFRHATGDSFDIYVTVYRDCNGTAMLPSPLTIKTACTTYTQMLTQVSVRDVTGLGPHCPQQSRCTGSYPYGVEEYIFKTRVRVGGDSCCLYTFSWEQCCRHSAITTGAADQMAYFETKYNKCLAPANTSPVFTLAPKFLLPVGKDANIAYSAADNTDNDLVTYSLTPPLQGPDTAITYTGSFTYKRPLSFLGFPNNTLNWPAGLHFDSLTGQMSVRPVVLNQVSTIGVKAYEWRKINGNWEVISEITRDVMVIVINGAGSANPPRVSSIVTGGGNGNTTTGEIVICNTTGPYCAEIAINENDSTSDTLHLTYRHNLKNITFTNIGTITNPIIKVCYTPDSAELAAPQLPKFVMEITDNECPLPGKTEKVFTFRAAGPMPDSFSIDKSLNCRDLTLTATNMSSVTGVSYSWDLLSPGSSTPYTITGASFMRTLDSGWHKIKLTVQHQNPNQFCDFRTYTDSVYIDPAKHMTVSAGPDATLCFNPVTTVTPIVTKGTSPFNYLWSDNTMAASNAYTAAPGKNTVWVKVTDANNCVAIDSMNIGYYNPKVVITGDTAQCINQGITLTAQLSDTTKSPVFGWSGFSINTATINPTLTASTQYDFTLTDGSGCIVNASRTVTAYNPQISASHPSAVCAGDSIQFTATTGGGLAPYTVSWAPFGLNGNSVKAGTSAAGIVNYTASVTDAFGCVKNQTGFVTVNALPAVNTVSPGVVCQSVNTLDLTLYSTPVGGTWSGPGVSGDSLNTSLSDTGLKNLDYLYTDNSTGCKNSASTWVYIELQPVASFTVDSLTGPVTHNFSFSNSSVKASYNSVTWDFGDPASGPANYATTLNTTHTFSDSGTYTVKLILSAGVCDPDTEVKVINVYRISGPNSIKNTGVTNAKVYPNPAMDMVTVEGDDIENIRIVDVQGREMNAEVQKITGSQCMVNVKSLSSGLYFVEITDIYHRVSQVKIAVQR